MKVALIGGCGRIGSRYRAILSMMKAEVRIYDMLHEHNPTPEILMDWCDKVLICSPTPTHLEWMQFCKYFGKPFLCEKPLVLPEQLKELKDLEGYVVNNWHYALQDTARSELVPISYDYYNTGQDGLYWDCCQLIYINPEVELKNESPTWDVTVRHRNNDRYLNYRKIEMSYIEMLTEWLFEDQHSQLWDIEDGVEMIIATVERMKRDGAIDSSPGQDKQYTPTQ